MGNQHTATTAHHAPENTVFALSQGNNLYLLNVSFQVVAHLKTSAEIKKIIQLNNQFLAVIDDTNIQILDTITNSFIATQFHEIDKDELIDVLYAPLVNKLVLYTGRYALFFNAEKLSDKTTFLFDVAVSKAAIWKGELITFAKKNHAITIVNMNQLSKITEFSIEAQEVFEILPVADNLFVAAGYDKVSAWQYNGSKFFSKEKLSKRFSAALIHENLLFIAHDTELSVYNIYADGILVKNISTTLNEDRFHKREIDFLAPVDSKHILVRNNAGIRIVNFDTHGELQYDTVESSKEDVSRVFNNVTVIDDKHFCILSTEVHYMFHMKHHSLESSNTYTFHGIALNAEDQSIVLTSKLYNVPFPVLHDKDQPQNVHLVYVRPPKQQEQGAAKKE